MIVDDQKIASLVASGALALGLFSSLAVPAGAAENETFASSIANLQSARTMASAPAVTIVRDGVDYTYTTKARTVGEFLAERQANASAEIAASYDADDAVVDGMRIVLRNATPIAAPSIVRAGLTKRDPVRRPRVVTWTSHVERTIVAKVNNRTDYDLPAGRTTVVDAGRAGVRLVVYRYVRRGGAAPVRTLLASRIVRMPRARVIAHGVAAYASLARVAEAGFASVAHFAGSAIHMIATAYTAGCYGCSGVTASGVRAGFGVIAVDPRVIPLGTKLFIPGYGRAVAGDTGGAILGNRIDLGMNTQRDALQFGRRPVTVYVLR